MQLCRLLFLSSLLGASLPACNDDGQEGTGTAERAVCERLLGCDCREPPYPDVDACLTALADEEAQERAQAEAEGRSHDAACNDEIRASHDAFACRTGDELVSMRRCPTCHPIHGDKGLDETCTESEDCTSELWCEDGRCKATISFCERIAVGERCLQGDQLLGVCVTGSFCDAGGTDRCEPARAIGSPCASASGCESLFCAGDGICEAPTIGQPCDSHGLCGDTLVCDQSLCAAPPGLGEACVAPVYVCAEGLDCWDPSDICQVPQALLCYLYQPGAAAAGAAAGQTRHRTR